MKKVVFVLGDDVELCKFILDILIIYFGFGEENEF